MNRLRVGGVVNHVAEGTTHDEEFLGVLYRRYYRGLLNYTLRLTNGDQHQAEDITQETLLRAWQHADSLDPNSALRWLYTVARNLAISTLHRGPRARSTETNLDQAESIATDDDLDRILESWQVLEALGGLSDNHRRVLIELFYHRKSIAEAAATLGVPSGTVKSRSYYALRALRDVLQERGGFAP